MRVSSALRAACALLAVSACGGKDKPQPGSFGVRFVTPAAAAYTNGHDVAIQVEVTGAYEGVDLVQDGAVVAELVPPEMYLWRASERSDGAYRLVARARRGTEQALSAPLTVVVDRAKPVALRSSPPDGGVAYQPFGRIEITFNEPMDPASLAQAVSSVKAAGTEVSLTVGVDGAKLWIEPSTWADPMEVSVAGLRDLAGNPSDAFSTSIGVTGARVIAGDRELGEARLSYVRLATGPAGRVLAAIADARPRVWRIPPGGPPESLDGLGGLGAHDLDVVIGPADEPLAAVGGPGQIGVFRHRGATWDPVGGALPDGSGGSGARIVLDGSGAPIVAWTAPIQNGTAPLRTEVRVARFDGTRWTLLPGFHAAAGEALGAASVAMIDGAPQVACLEALLGSNASPSVVLRRWDGAAWQQVLDTGVSGAPELRSVAGLHPSLSILSRTSVRVFSRGDAWTELAPLAWTVDPASTASGWAATADAAPAPADAALLAVSSDQLFLEWRPPGLDWRTLGFEGVPGTRATWPAFVVDADGSIDVAYVARGGAGDYLVSTSFVLSP